MIKTLVLLRHAKSDRLDFSVRDFDRPLNERGFIDAKNVAKWLTSQIETPDLVISSAALRKKNTANEVVSAFNLANEKWLETQSLYLASGNSILYVLSEVSPSINTLVLVGHNDGISEIADFLASTSIAYFKTACGVIFNFEQENWDLSENQAKVIKEFSPKSI